jgi:hypothetical protein
MSLESTLFPGEIVFDESNKELWQDDGGGGIHAGGEYRLFARVPNPDFKPKPLKSFGAVYGDFPESEWDARIDEQIALEARVSDYITNPPFDQDGLPTCWAINTAQCATILRVCMGLPFVQLSGCSIAVPISGGHSGGDELEANEYAIEHGIASVEFWPENDTTKSLNKDPKVIADRLNHKVLEWLEMESKANWVSACLRTKPGVFAYNSMSHVMAMCDVVRIEKGSIEKGSLGFRVRNSWAEWDVKNSRGVSGFQTYRATPDSGACMNQITASLK